MRRDPVESATGLAIADMLWEAGIPPNVFHVVVGGGQVGAELLERPIDGVFFTAVRTTGIFCRPGCTARTPLRQNVEFFRTASDALFAGYRPCKRCRPLEPRGEAPEWLRGMLDTIEREPDRRIRDADLREAGLDPARVRRWFQAHHGMTFQAYQRARRLGRALGQLTLGDDIVQTAYRSGFESLSGFNDAVRRLAGDSPGRARGTTVIHLTRVLTPLGPMIAGATGEIRLPGIRTTRRSRGAYGDGARQHGDQLVQVGRGQRRHRQAGRATGPTGGQPGGRLPGELPAPLRLGEDLPLVREVAAGALQARGTVSGPWTAPRIAARATGDAVSWQTYSAQDLSLAADVDLSQGGPVFVDLERPFIFEAGRTTQAALMLRAEGTPSGAVRARVIWNVFSQPSRLTRRVRVCPALPSTSMWSGPSPKSTSWTTSSRTWTRRGTWISTAPFSAPASTTCSSRDGFAAA